MSFVDISGQRFGKLVAIGPHHSVPKRGWYWLCKCDCGNEKLVTAGVLRSGMTKSCGCLQSPIKEDLTGKIIAGMTVLGLEKEIAEGMKRRRWICKCQYGKIHYCTASNLQRMKGCSCEKSKLKGLNGPNNPSYKHGDSHTRLYNILRGIKRRCYEPGYRSYENYGGRGIKVCDEWLGEDGFEHFRDWALINGYKEGLSIDRIDVNGDYCPQNCRWSTNVEQCNNRRNNVRLTWLGETHTIAEWARILNVSPHTLYDRYRKGWKVEDILYYKENKNHVNQFG